MSKIAIITARGGSKRIPHKNIKDFCGSPILTYSIKAAIASDIFDEVMVSTDDVEIAQVAKDCGAKVPFMRSEKTSDDYSTTAEVLMEVLADYQKVGKSFEWMCCIYPTAPFVTAEKLKQSFLFLENKKADALVPVVRFSFPPQRCFIVKDQQIEYKWPQYAMTRSQDLEPLYHDAGQFYFIKSNVFLEQKTMVPKKTIPYILDEMEVQDIDNIDDWNIAEIKFQAMKSR